MATVNLLNNNWITSSEGSMTVDVTGTYVEFLIPTSASDWRQSAKACTAINASKYKTISFNYSSVSHSGNTSLIFGVFDDSSYSNTSGSIAISDSIGNWDREDGGSCTLDISGLTGTKYVGFWFYGNAEGARARDKIYITSLTATERSYTLTYNANGGSGAPSAVSNITSAIISSTVPTRSSYDFLGWSTSSSATYATYFAGNTISLSSNTTLYAVWRKFYTVTYDANGGSNAPNPDKKIDGETIAVGTTLPTPPANASVIYTVILNANGGTCDPNRITVTNVVTYDFVDWNTKSDGSGMSYKFGDLYSNNSDITLYAQYTSTTTYNSVTLPIPLRSGHDFLGWSINEEAISGMLGEYTPTENETTLYATWKRRGLAYIRDNVGGFSPYEVFIYDSSGWNLYVPYIRTGSGWIEYSG